MSDLESDFQVKLKPTSSKDELPKLPEVVVIIPIMNSPIFPGMIAPIILSEEKLDYSNEEILSNRPQIDVLESKIPLINALSLALEMNPTKRVTAIELWKNLINTVNKKLIDYPELTIKVPETFADRKNNVYINLFIIYGIFSLVLKNGRLYEIN